MFRYFEFFLVSILLLSFYCKSSSAFVTKFIDLNYNDEGFLTNEIVQTIGISEIRNDSEDKNNIKIKCLWRAENIAKEKMVSIFIQTYQESNNKLKKNRTLKKTSEVFSKSELIYWSLVFDPLLMESRVTLKEIDKNSCKVVLHLKKKDLISVIQNWNPFIL